MVEFTKSSNTEPAPKSHAVWLQHRPEGPPSRQVRNSEPQGGTRSGQAAGRTLGAAHGRRDAQAPEPARAPRGGWGRHEGPALGLKGSPAATL